MSVDRFKPIGSYSTSVGEVGDIVTCEVRGEMRVNGLTNAPIIWPVAPFILTKHRSRTVFNGVCKALV